MCYREKNGMTEEAHKIIKTIRQMESSLEDRKSHEYLTEEGELRVYAPLTRCVKDLKEKYNTIAKVHRERFEQVKSEYVTAWKELR
jgi:protein regulator of cytokinesis 1